MTRSGFVALAGRPNAGKSTLVNQIVGGKVAIVSDKPQTTRREIRGVATGEDWQLVLVDLPACSVRATPSPSACSDRWSGRCRRGRRPLRPERRAGDRPGRPLHRRGAEALRRTDRDRSEQGRPARPPAHRARARDGRRARGPGRALPDQREERRGCGRWSSSSFRSCRRARSCTRPASEATSRSSSSSPCRWRAPSCRPRRSGCAFCDSVSAHTRARPAAGRPRAPRSRRPPPRPRAAAPRACGAAPARAPARRGAPRATVGLLLGRVEERALRAAAPRAADHLGHARRRSCALTGKISPGTSSVGGRRAARCTVRARSSRSTLFTTVTAGTPARFDRLGDEAVARPDSCSPFSTNSTASESASSRSTRRCIRSVSGSRGRWTPGRSTSTSCQSSPVAMPRIARRVVCGLSETIATFSPTIWLTSVDLPAFGPPGERHEAGAASQRRHHPVLEREHLAVVGLVVVAAQVQHAVDDRLGQVLGVLGADHDVAELARAGRSGSPSSTGNESTSVGRSMPRCSRLSSLDRASGPTTRSPGGRRPRRPRASAASTRRAAAPPDVDDSISIRRASRCAAGLAERRRLLLGVLVVGRDDPLHELVPDHVLAAEAHELDALDALEDVADHDAARSAGPSAGRSA